MATRWADLVVEESIPAAQEGKGQGYFRYYRADGSHQTIMAVGGKLYVDGGSLTITGLATGFQVERQVEAVQYGAAMFIATGSGLVEYDGTSAKVVDPFKPTPLDALYIGTNALADNPDAYLTDGTSTFLQAAGIIPQNRIGIAEKDNSFTAYYNAPAGTTVEYRWEYKLKKLETWVLLKDYATTNKTVVWKPDRQGEWQVRCLMRTQGTTTPVEISTIPLYKVSVIDENKTVNTNTIDTCNRIFLHYDRLFIYGDTTKSNQVYISHLRNPRYFPSTNTVLFESNEQEPVTRIIKYRDFLVSFLPSSIQALFGKGPAGDDPYQRVVLHTGLGCIAAESPAVLGNVIAFLSKDGVYILKSFGIANDKMNVEKIDLNIDDQILLDKEACGIVFRDQYWLCFPGQQIIYRYYRKWGIWSRDTSGVLNVARFYEWNGDLNIQSAPRGTVHIYDDTLYTDLGEIYKASVRTKKYDFGEPHNPKKLKEFQLIVGQDVLNEKCSVVVFGDDVEIVRHDPISSANTRVEINEETNVAKIPLTPRGKTRTAQAEISHKENEEFVLLGVGFVFKSKKP